MMNECKKIALDFFKGWKVFFQNMNYLISSILFVLVYVFGVGSSFLLVKLFKKKFFDMESEKLSYWHEVENTNDIENYYKQF